MVEGKVEEWMGFACKKCGTPLAVERSGHGSASGELSPTGWRVTCTACGETEYYEPGSPMVRITISTGSKN
jgi:RNase P subunit RPR2